ncbi:MAG: hypothetical protein OEW59_09910, partial [Gammaproteobacteria bacterium]|nr:hypothetical protein [Gammaproteobacteria bacterium]
AVTESTGAGGGLVDVGASIAESFVDATVHAYVGNNNLIEAKSLSVQAKQDFPGGSNSAKSDAVASSGSLIGVTASESTADTEGEVKGYVGDGSTLRLSDSINVKAFGNSKQFAEVSGITIGGLLALGFNDAAANSDMETLAYLGNNVSVSGGDDIGGLTDGEDYYVVYDDERTFNAASAGAVDLAANTISFSTNHGLQTGDQVTYLRQGGTAITGLTNGTTYYAIRVDANTIKLATTAYKASIDDESDLTVLGTGTQKIVFEDPRRFKLATSLDSGGGSAAIVNLDASVATGSQHSLSWTSFGGPEQFVFNPATAVDSGNDTLALPSGLAEGTVVTYSRGAGPTLTLLASGSDNNFAQASAGSGGLIAGAGADADTNTVSVTRAFIGDATVNNNASPDVSILVSSVDIDATHTATINTIVDTFLATAVGGSGASADNNVNSVVEAEIGDYVKLATTEFDMDAVNKTLKPELSDYNAQAGAGGVFVGSAASSETDVINVTRAAIGTGADVELFQEGLEAGTFSVNAYNEITAYDKVKNETYGAITGAGATSNIRAGADATVGGESDFDEPVDAHPYKTTVEVGAGASIITAGDAVFSGRTKAFVDVRPQVKTGGFASAGIVDGEATVHATNEVIVGGGSHIKALGNVHLLAGRDVDGTRDRMELTSFGDEANASVIPIEDLESKAEGLDKNFVTIASGALVETARSANLIAEKDSIMILTAKAIGKNWFTALSDALDSLFGGEDVNAS